MPERSDTPSTGDLLADKLSAACRGDVLFDAFSRGRYATDASIYQVMPKGVLVPRDNDDVAAALAIAREEGVSLLPRGGGTSQCGQTVNSGVVIDGSKHLNRILEIDSQEGRCRVQPGIVLDELNKALKPHGLWFPVDVSTSSRATIGGMTGNNSCGARSLRYGTMRDNVIAIEGLMADGNRIRFGPTPRDLAGVNEPSPARDLFADLLAMGAREQDEIRARFPDLMRRVGGYNIDALIPNGPENNLAHLLVGSEGGLAFSTEIELKLSPLPRNKTLGICHFPTFYAAMDAAQHIVKLDPTAVELVDRTMIELSRDIEIFRPVVERFVRGTPDALLLVEFAEEEQDENLRRLKALGALMGDLGFAWDKDPAHCGGVVEAIDPDFQKAVWEVRKQGLNIMMSMRVEGKPISFVEDCAVRLEDLAEYTDRLTQVFEKHGTKGTWYAHASVGCLHVRPVLNLKLDEDVRKMRAIAEEAFEMVREYKGSHSGEHGDGIVRSEFHEEMFGTRLVRDFEEVKDRFDPQGLFNPGKIVRPPKMDTRELFRYAPGYGVGEMRTALDWSGFYGAGGGFQGAVEMCNNNGACRKLDAGVMCPSYRVTRNERDLTRGRANTLRLAISGQLGPRAFASDEMMETMKLCVSCKACKRECPTGVDMAKMKIEVLSARAKEKGLSLHDKLVAHMPRYAPYAARISWLVNLRDRIPGLAALSEKLAGFSAKRPLPRWSGKPFRKKEAAFGPADGPEVVLLADTFNRYFEPENLEAALSVLVAGGYRVHLAEAKDGGRPLCCGRTYLSAGLVEEARAEARRTLDTLLPFVRRGVSVVGLEPSCLLGLRDEFLSMLPGEDSGLLSRHSKLFEEFLAEEAEAGRLTLPLASKGPRKALLHGHCHQKAFAAMGAVEKVLALVPDLDTETVQSSCCGMAGAFGYGKDTYDTSMAMAELSLLPKVRQATEDTMVIADGTSCRHQIADGSGRSAQHVARVLADALS